MQAQSVKKLFVATLLAAPAAFAVALTGSDRAAAGVTRILFVAVVLAEVGAFVEAARTRRLFSPSDAGHLTWTLITAFLLVRSLAELRTATLTLGFVPRYSDGASSLLFVYSNVLRYLYTASDLLMVGALATTVRAYKSTGLKFGLILRDYAYMFMLWAVPMITWVFRENLFYGGAVGRLSMSSMDRYIATYRLIGAWVVTLVVTLCLVVRRYAVQMGGGAIARVWNTVVLAVVARAVSFAGYTLLLRNWQPAADFAEQYLTWCFAVLWVIAAKYQRETMTGRIARVPPV